MTNMIRKTPDSLGIFLYMEDADVDTFSTVDWEYDPDTSGVLSVPRKYWKYDGTSIVAEMTQTEKDAVDKAILEANAELNSVGHFTFGHWGNADNIWLRRDGLVPSNQMPVVFMGDAVVSGLTWICTTDHADADILIYKNETLFYTWSLTDRRTAYKTNDLAGLTFSAGDRLNVLVRSSGITPQSPSVTVYYRYTTNITSESGSATL